MHPCRPRGLLGRRVAVLALVATAVGCSSAPNPGPRVQTPASAATTESVAPKLAEASPTPFPVAAAERDACPTAYAVPDPLRPVISLTFDVAADRRTVRGTEHLVFTPDLAITELVFRLWPDNPRSSSRGARLRVLSATAEGELAGGRFVLERAGAPTGRSTLLRLPLSRPVPAGTAVRAEIAFELTLPPAGVDRYGSDGRTAWWGSGHPLLAWERGRGWARDPAVGLLGETATSEAARIDLTVAAPVADVVLAAGRFAGVRPAGPGRRSWRWTAEAARDVAVTVGPLRVRRGTAAGVPLTVAAPAGSPVDLEVVLRLVSRSVERLSASFGPFPYPALVVTSLPSLGRAGVEYPGAILVGRARLDVVVAHEVAHQWFYGLVGNDQARDPWLDESFATYAESLVNGTSGRYLDSLSTAGRVGAGMSHWAVHPDRYFATVYAKGAAALLTARRSGGEARFDAALRCYVARSAHAVADPADVAFALAGVPAAVAVLRRAGALP